MRNNILLRRGAEHLHQLGPRAIAEFLIAFADAHPTIVADLMERLVCWRSLDPDVLQKVVGVFCCGREFPPALSVLNTGSEGSV